MVFELHWRAPSGPSGGDPASAGEPYFSMLRLSGIHIPNRDRIHMAFQAYYDGSGKADLPAMTLTGVAAPEELWQRFEPLWVDALDRNTVPDRDFHMTDLMAKPRRGKLADWDDRRVEALLTDLWNVFGRFRTEDLAAYSCTVFFDAHKQAKQLIPALRSPEAICVDYCVGSLQLTKQQLASEPKPILLYFDRKEKFMHTVNRVWLQGKKHPTGRPSQVRNIIVADRSYYYPIQAADMLGWIINRNRLNAARRGKAQPYQRLVFDEQLDKYEAMFVQTWFMIWHFMQWYDEPQKIVKRYPNG